MQMLEKEKIGLILKINGVQHQLNIEPRVTLLDALREYLGLTGTKLSLIHI